MLRYAEQILQVKRANMKALMSSVCLVDLGLAWSAQALYASTTNTEGAH